MTKQKVASSPEGSNRVGGGVCVNELTLWVSFTPILPQRGPEPGGEVRL
jgi:hypothetical protein